MEIMLQCGSGFRSIPLEITNSFDCIISAVRLRACEQSMLVCAGEKELNELRKKVKRN